MEPTPGSMTSEFKFAKVVFFVGLALDVAAGVLHQLQGSGVAFPWFPTVLAGIGALMNVVSFLGYSRSRTAVKVAEALAKKDSP